MSSRDVPLLWPPEVVEKPGVQEAADVLIDAWEAARLHLNAHDRSSEKDAIALFARTVLGRPLRAPGPLPNGRWVPVVPGSLCPGDIVRVHDNLYTGELGDIHNGRVCEVLWQGGGDIVVASLDSRSPRLDGAHYSPHDLDQLVPLADIEIEDDCDEWEQDDDGDCLDH